MNNSLFRSAFAVLAGFVFIAITHNGMDYIMESTGVLPRDNLYVSSGLILWVLVYRAVLSFVGCYITAALAPKSPAGHSLFLGAIGTVLSALGTVAMANKGPVWYGIALVLMALPIAYAAGKYFEHRRLAKVL